MLHNLRAALVLLLAFTLLTGVAYPLAITGVGWVMMQDQALGSLVEKDGKVVGSSLVGQSFTTERYFHPRPSATSGADPADASKTIDAPYNAAASTGSNLGPITKKLARPRAGERRRAARGGRRRADPGRRRDDLGERPRSRHLARQRAAAGAARRQGARPPGGPGPRPRRRRGRRAVRSAVLGEPRVNVLRLNLALDALKP